MIDLRSDVCVPPTAAMWDAMRAAPAGFAGADETVAQLERDGAELLSAEAAVFVPTCTMANISALLTLTRPGDTVVLEESSHILANEGDGITALAALEPLRIPGERGRLDPTRVAEAIERHGATLLCLENTHTRAGGTVLDTASSETLARTAHDAGARVHLDGARLANAAVALDVPLASLAAPADTVSFSFNKSLGAPFGALLAGGHTVIDTARAILRRLGGTSVHKAGIFAAAALVALSEMEERIVADHLHARALAAALRDHGLALRDDVETNIVTVLPERPAHVVLSLLADRGILALSLDGRSVRLVTHRLIGEREIEQVAAAIAAAARERPRSPRSAPA